METADGTQVGAALPDGRVFSSAHTRQPFANRCRAENVRMFAATVGGRRSVDITWPMAHASISTTLNIPHARRRCVARQAIEAVERDLFPTVSQLFPSPRIAPPQMTGMLRKMEAPSGFEPEMEVLQTGPGRTSC